MATMPPDPRRGAAPAWAAGAGTGTCLPAGAGPEGSRPVRHGGATVAERVAVLGLQADTLAAVMARRMLGDPVWVGLHDDAIVAALDRMATGARMVSLLAEEVAA